MNKKIKVVIAILIIGIVVAGAFFFLGTKTDNKQIRANVYDLNYKLERDDENVYKKINDTILEMYKLINTKGFSVLEVKNDFNFYIELLDYYQPLQKLIIENGVLVNDVNTNDYYKRMNGAYKRLRQIYMSGYEYLLGTYYVVSPNALTDAVYLVSFHSIFKEALTQMNIFYYNAGMAYSYGVSNTYYTNNLNNLKAGYYALLVNTYAGDYLEDGKVDLNINVRIKEQGNKLFNKDASNYIDKKSEYDKLMKTSRKINLKQLVLREVKGEYTTYLSEIKKAEKKSIAEKYYELIIKG